MYNLTDTIAAFSSSPTSDTIYHIIRISGPSALDIISTVAVEPLSDTHMRLVNTKLTLEPDLTLDATLYIFRSPHSYTGDDLIELHLLCPQPIARAVLSLLFTNGARPAQPGEFTSRAYMNGKLDLAQAQAVAQIITATNTIQLRAAQQLLKGAFQAKLSHIQNDLLDILSLLEASLDFSQDDIEFITADQLAQRNTAIVAQIKDLLENSLPARQLLALPSVAIAGSSNAGKSSLFNALLRKSRSIVSHELATTRDVLTEILKLEHAHCAIFDCAGLLSAPSSPIDQLAESAARDAIAAADLVIFCVDASASDFSADLALYRSINPNNTIFCATKSDLPNAAKNIELLRKTFNADFIPASSLTAQNLPAILSRIDSALAASGDNISSQLIALDNRQRISLKTALDDLNQIFELLKSDNRPVISMLIRDAYGTLSEISQPHTLDEAVLDRIFSKFCIGK